MADASATTNHGLAEAAEEVLAEDSAPTSHGLTEAAEEVLKTVRANRSLGGKYTNPNTGTEAWQHDHVKIGMPTWISMIDVGNVCPLYTMLSCSSTSCRMEHMCIVCRTEPHAAFGQTGTYGNQPFVCPTVRSLADAGHDVLEEEKKMDD